MSHPSFAVTQNQSGQVQTPMHTGCYGALQHMANQLCSAGQYMTAQSEHFQKQLHEANFESHNSRQEFQAKIQDLEVELARERKTCEHSFQGLSSKETECAELQKEVAELRQKLEETTKFLVSAEHVAKKAGDTLQANLSHGSGEAHENIDIGEFLIQCGRSTALLQMLYSGPDEQRERYNIILEHNANHQRRIKDLVNYNEELRNRNEELSRKLEARPIEVANVPKALEICTEDGNQRRKGPNRSARKSSVKREDSA